jgi:cation:H+ antiporter
MRTKISFDGEKSIEVFVLIVSNIYFSFIAIKGSLTVADSIFLVIFYAVYLRLLSKGHKRDEADLVHDKSELPWVGRKIIAMKSKNKKVTSIILLFVLGGAVLQMSAEPFLHSLEALAVTWGVSSFVFVQWVAPFVSEFPEKVTALNWARKTSKAPMAFMNIVSSNIVQWTLMAAMVPIVYSLSKGAATPIFFDKFQTSEIVLTIAQSVLSILILMDLEVDLYNALVLFFLWLVQFFKPGLREEIVYAYIFFIVIELILLIRKKKALYALNKLREILRKA